MYLRGYIEKVGSGTRDMLTKTAAELLDVDVSLIEMTLDEMINVRDVITDMIPHICGRMFFARIGFLKYYRSICIFSKNLTIREISSLRP